MTAPKRPDPGSRKAQAAAAPKPAAAAKPPAAVPKPPAAVPEKPPARGPLLAKLLKELKAQYKPEPPPPPRPLLEQVLFACCLENAPQAVAERAFTRLLETAYDLNEIRVTTVAELSESLAELPDPPRAALALRRVLQSVFESTYNYSLEQAGKQTLAHGLRTLENLHGVSPFVLHHVGATALGGHFIPLDLGALSALYLCGIITRSEYDAGRVPGIERAIAKKAAAELNPLLHRFGIDCLQHLHGATVRRIAAAVSPAAKDRFPKRGEPLPPPNPPPPAATKEQQKVAEAARQSAEAHRPAGPQAAARPAGKTPLPPVGAGPKRTDAKGAKPGPKPFVVKPNMGKPAAPQPPAAEAPASPTTAGIAAPKPIVPSTAKAADAAPSSKKPAADPAGSPPGKAQAKPAKPAAQSAAGARQPARPPAKPAPKPPQRDRQPPPPDKRPAAMKPAARKPKATGGHGDGRAHSRQLAKRKPR